MRIPLFGGAMLRSTILYVAAFTACLTLFVSEAHPAGRDFIPEARLIYRAVACAGDVVPDGIDASVVRAHCRGLRADIERYRKNFVDKAGPFFAGVVPADIPRRIVIPFGGGDLLPALLVYPQASEYTTISLEGAGDPRRLGHSDRVRLAAALKAFRSSTGLLLLSNDSSNQSIRVLEQGPVPNQLAYALIALAVAGYEPVSLTFFTIRADGGIHYLSEKEIDALQAMHGRRLKQSWVDSDYSVAFRNMELAFRKIGAGSAAPLIIHRHIAFNLDDRHLQGSGLFAYLKEKGRIAVMVKGASYLLWMDNFKILREYLLSHMAFMVSDSTGILPRHARRAGFEQITYGRFSGAFLSHNGGTDALSLRGLWEGQPYRPLDFRFGYSDVHGYNHLMITRPKAESGFH
jgi:hypothetical protein